MKTIVGVEIECGKTTCLPCRNIGVFQNCLAFTDESGQDLPLKRVRSKSWKSNYKRLPICLAGGVKEQSK